MEAPAIVKSLKSLTASQEAERKTWQYRAVLATRGNQTRLGCILLAVLQRSAGHSAPRFGHAAEITADGMVVSRFQQKDGTMHAVHYVCRIAEMIEMFRRLADTLQLDGFERECLFVEVRRWITKDHRAHKEMFT